MAFMLYSIDEAIDCKYVVTKTMSGQAKAGTLIHVMDTKERSDGGVQVDYRVTGTGQNFVIKFDSVKAFCKWARPDTFIARHYDSFTKKEIQHYLKVQDRSFVTFCLPLIILAAVVVWGIAAALMSGAATVIFGIIFTLIAAVAVLFLFKKQKESVKLKLYSKINMGISFK
ncbi:MAG: hypothetical protein IJ696_00495 [Ruminococcus sp.]|nr:hypothetical protein [Ruminococcus sp.]